MWNPLSWAELSNDVTLGNARTASTELSRRRLEREEVEAFLAEHIARVTKRATG